MYQEIAVVDSRTIGHREDTRVRIDNHSTTLELLAKSASLEVTRQRIKSAKHFNLHGADEWSGFEFIFLLSGSLPPDDMQEMMALARSAEENGYLGGAAQIVTAHLERFCGTGYPRGLKGEEIPIGARIIAVVDAYDAMTSTRLYHNAFSRQGAIEELRRNSDTQFDPRVVGAFVEVTGAEGGR